MEIFHGDITCAYIQWWSGLCNLCFNKDFTHKNRDFTKWYNGICPLVAKRGNGQTSISRRFSLLKASVCAEMFKAICNYRRATPSNNPLNLHLSHSYPEMIPLKPIFTIPATTRILPGFEASGIMISHESPMNLPLSARKKSSSRRKRSSSRRRCRWLTDVAKPWDLYKVRWFTHETWWFSICYNVYQGVYM